MPRGVTSIPRQLKSLEPSELTIGDIGPSGDICR